MLVWRPVVFRPRAPPLLDEIVEEYLIPGNAVRFLVAECGDYSF
jgi:hypothetical protein